MDDDVENWFERTGNPMAPVNDVEQKAEALREVIGAYLVSH